MTEIIKNENFKEGLRSFWAVSSSLLEMLYIFPSFIRGCMQAKVSNTKLEKHEQIGGWVGFMTAYAGYIGQIYLYRHAIESYGWKAFIPLIATNTASSFYEKARKKKIGTRSKNLDSIIE